MDKKLLRSQTLQKRDTLADRHKKSDAICQKVVQSDVFRKAKTVFVYLSFRSEVETQLIIDKCFASDKKVCVPVCKKDCVMDAVVVEDMSNLVYNGYGIAEPTDVTKVMDKSVIDLCIVPGSVFDRQLNRIGYGKGYYDRYLRDTGIKKVALAFDCQIADAVPVDKYDVKMDCIITEKEVLGIL